MSLRIFKVLSLSIFLLLSGALSAASLPAAMSENDIGQLVQAITIPSVTKLMRSAEPYNDLFPGFKIGLEINVLAPQNMNLLGDGTGAIPGFIPAPRIYLAKSLPANLEIIFSFMPSSLSNIVSTTGGILKWSFYNEKETFISGAAYAGVTGVSAFSGLYTGKDLEAGLYLSKDFVRIRPYLGAGLLYGDGNIPAVLASTPVTSTSQIAFHGFFGMEIELPIELGFQVDLFNVTLRGSMLIGKTF